MFSSAKRLLASVLCAALLAAPVSAFENRAKAGFVIDHTTGTILFSKRADEALPPASMSKLMTLYMAFEAVRDGRLNMEEKLPVSQHAMNYGGSTMFLDTTDRVKVVDLIRGIIVLSGNDACAVIAETLSPDGTEAGFARQMTLRARQMGMTSSTFANSNGWPAPGHRMSMRDLALLANRLITDFPEFYPMFSETKFEFDGRAPQNVNNRNPLLRLGVGADGLKTGHTQEAGYGLVGSAKQGPRRVIFAVSGMTSAKERAEVSEQIVNWAFRQFSTKTILRAGKRVADADVWMGDAPRVGLVATDDIDILVPVSAGDEIAAEVVYNGPLQAPIEAGQEIAELVIQAGDLPEVRVPLVAESSVTAGGFSVRMRTATAVLMKNFGLGS
ncbi:D-alanyl-D-alanine carboxypeptidase family protein [Cognatishimia activa]|uniref:serine-type D-Ala-D-Ala carboxypeptidase n=1 Tax=Cognatishimia activa TaxID=1715691 RepID=A0A975ENC6_9RHOB|nr:D-alanyl-D-alanine carboxypeptidase family protein [Cognatishimia activa]QTN35164.1 D-alanyl-D-alanine carboxypeptidase [Cognatishimia activa]